MRTPIIAGNWKMNMTPPEAQALVKALLPLAKDAKCQVVVCPPFVCLPSVRALLSGSNVALGAQNMHYEAKGAFTGEVSADMLKAVGVEYVILGHSERRQYFAETDETVNKKAKAALQAGLTPIICVGESLEQREAGKAESVVSTQTALAFDGLSAEDAAKAVVAYEPIWAIGTGKTATKEDANTTIGTIRKALRGMYGDVADAIRIQYGGSMNAKNASELMAMPEIDGGLIGGASLKAEDFSCIIHF